MELKIITRTWCPEQSNYVYEFIADNISATANAPADMVYGSSCICLDGVYFYFEQTGWYKVN